jgi:hypothetical protein
LQPLQSKAPVAQLDRASAFGAGGWGFKSLRAYSGRGARSILAPLPEYVWSLRNPLEFATIKPANSLAVLRMIAGGGRPGVIKSLRAYSGRGARSILAPLPEYVWSLRNPLEFATIKPANSQAVLRVIVGGGRPGLQIPPGVDAQKDAYASTAYTQTAGPSRVRSPSRQHDLVSGSIAQPSGRLLGVKSGRSPLSESRSLLLARSCPQHC